MRQALAGLVLALMAWPAAAQTDSAFDLFQQVCVTADGDAAAAIVKARELGFTGGAGENPPADGSFSIEMNKGGSRGASTTLVIGRQPFSPTPDKLADMCSIAVYPPDSDLSGDIANWLGGGGGEGLTYYRKTADGPKVIVGAGEAGYHGGDLRAVIAGGPHEVAMAVFYKPQT